MQVLREVTLEVKLSIDTRWSPDCPEWKLAAMLVGKHCYQQCLDELEGLIVSRMFKLTKMNMSQTGVYFLNEHTHKLMGVLCRV